MSDNSLRSSPRADDEGHGGGGALLISPRDSVHEADDEIHTAGGESGGQRLNAQVIILNYCFGPTEVPFNAALFTTTRPLRLQNEDLLESGSSSSCSRSFMLAG